MNKSTMRPADGQDVRQLGAIVAQLLKDSPFMTTESVRTQSHFGNTTFSKFKREIYAM